MVHLRPNCAAEGIKPLVQNRWTVRTDTPSSDAARCTVILIVLR